MVVEMNSPLPPLQGGGGILKGFSKFLFLKSY